MLAGDSIILYGILLWVMIAVGPWWVALIIFGVSLLAQIFHLKYLNNARIRSMEALSKELGTPVPPSIQKQIEDKKNRSALRKLFG